jgi:hypothetical protein
MIARVADAAPASVLSVKPISLLGHHAIHSISPANQASPVSESAQAYPGTTSTMPSMVAGSLFADFSTSDSQSSPPLTPLEGIGSRASPDEKSNESHTRPYPETTPGITNPSSTPDDQSSLEAIHSRTVPDDKSDGLYTQRSETPPHSPPPLTPTTSASASHLPVPTAVAHAQTTSRGILIDYDYSSFLSGSGDMTGRHRTVSWYHILCHASLIPF